MKAVLWLLLAAGLQALQTAPPRDTRPANDRRSVSGRAVIRGRVFAADTGRPLARATIAVSASGVATTHEASISTDSEGRYELVDVPAGSYIVRASRDGYLELQYGQRFPRDRATTLSIDEATITNLDFSLPRMSVVSGRITDEHGEPLAGVRVVASPRPRTFQNPPYRYGVSEGHDGKYDTSAPVTTSASGEYRISDLSPGAYMVAAVLNETWPSPEPGDRRVGYSRTYFPGVITQSEATVISVGAGQETSDISFSLTPGRLATVTGMALHSRGHPLQTVVLTSADRLGGGISTLKSVETDGTFRFSDVRPGSYVLVGAGDGEVVRIVVDVDGSDTSVSVMSDPGWSVSGRVSADSGAQSPLDLRRVAIRRGEKPDVVVAGAGAAFPDASGLFTLGPVFGRSRFYVSLPQGWVLKSATAGDRDLVGTEIDLPPGSTLSDVQILVTDRTGGVSGRVVGNGGAPSLGTVIVFSEDPARWWSWTGAIREARADRDGAFRIEGLPAGRYAITAVDYVDVGMWLDHDYLRSLLPSAARVTLSEDEHRSQLDVRVIH